MNPTAPPQRVLLVGTAGALRQLQAGLAFGEDDAPAVLGRVLPELPAAAAGDDRPEALGAFADLPRLLTERQPDAVLLSLPVAMATVARQLGELCDAAGVVWRYIPTLADQLAGRVLVPVRSRQTLDSAGLDLARLIDRPHRPLDDDAIRGVLEDRIVLITGAGGSIGSELARCVASFQPKRLILLERSENALFEIRRHLLRLFPKLDLRAILHDVTQSRRTLHVLEDVQPQVIFHAAAHKHVPMMEDHPAEAIENNFYGTRWLAEAADAVGADRFVMISSDKAVNPTSIMGATKRLAELFIQWLNERSATTFSMVRFGNVLGSACSVLPIWSQQLAQGLPVTVTDPRMTRYFMTIPEAAGLVIQSAAYAGQLTGTRGGEVFVLDMGQPIRVLDLAERFIRAHGLEPGRDVPIQLTGIRPGEKLFEELKYDGEGMLPTPHQAIHLWRTTPPDTARMQQIIARFDRLRDPRQPTGHAWQHATEQALRAAIAAAVPEMQPSAAIAAAG